jgi:formate hydrogenlyase regulatory protein HycA
VVVSHSAADTPRQVHDASSQPAIAQLIATVPVGGSLVIERVEDPTVFAMTCPLDNGRFYIRYDDGRGGSFDTERMDASDAGKALHAWATQTSGWQDAFDWKHSMPVPDRIPIAHEPGFRTDLIGSWAEGYFLAGFCDVTYLHLFDHHGTHERSEIAISERALGETSTDALMDHLRQVVDELPDRRFENIAVRTFSIEHEGKRWGLFDETVEHGQPHAELRPDWLGFGPPWNGLYDT